MTRVGVLALQGDVPEQVAALVGLLGSESVQLVRAPSDLSETEALLMPGGESTTIGHLLRTTELDRAIEARASDGLPILATCAGLILIAREIEASPGGRDPTPLGLLDVRVRRNDYGRQRESFEAPVRVTGLTPPEFPGVFIRAPRLLEVGPSATAIAYRGEEVVGVRQGPIFGLTFHPELSRDPRILEMFLAAAGIPAAARVGGGPTRGRPAAGRRGPGA